MIDRIVQIGDVLISPDIFTEYFCCDLESCKGECCIEGDAGAPVTLEEVAEIEDALDTVWSDLSAPAQAVIDKQGVAYTDEEGDLVTSIVGGKDCVFTYYSPLQPPRGEAFGSQVMHCKDSSSCCLCALEKAYRAGKTKFCKPISCALYPIREVQFSNGTVGLNYHVWNVCKCGRDKGKELKLPVWKFLEGPLKRRFGEEWYQWLTECAEQLEQSEK